MVAILDHHGRSPDRWARHRRFPPVNWYRLAVLAALAGFWLCAAAAAWPLV